MKLVSLARAGLLLIVGVLLVVLAVQLYYDAADGGGADLSPPGCLIFGTLLLVSGLGSLYVASRAYRGQRSAGAPDRAHP